jgi:formate dehydrogenase alpha subunit
LKQMTFTINGQSVKGESGNTIIDVAQNYGIPVPTLCHDPCFDSIGACRVCLVEDEKRGNLVAACVTPASEGLAIRTDSQKVLDARKVVVKLMLASHPDSCIICEKGNRCKLRQIAADLGIGLIDYYPMPVFTGTQEVNPFIRRDLSKCILCAKCIRADHELVVEGAIDYIDRGFDAKPSTFTEGPLEVSECTFCGTCLEICPTGALFESNKRYRGTASKRTATTCNFCGCGCSFWLETSHNQVVGVRPGIPDSVNGMTMCSKGHFGYEFINHPERLKNPLVRKNSELAEASWDEAFQAAAQGFKTIKEKNGPGSLALLAGPHCTNEEAFLLKKIASEVLKTKHLGCSSTEYMSNLIPAMEETVGFVGPGGSIQDFEDAEAILVIGANPTETAPIVGYSIKRAVRKKQAALIVIDPLEIKLTKYANLWLRPMIGMDEILLLGFLGLLIENKSFQKGLLI